MNFSRVTNIGPYFKIKKKKNFHNRIIYKTSQDQTKNI